jgi:hypothetical protein
MFYVPGRCLFIHIPRTAGTSLTYTVASQLRQSCLVCTAQIPGPIHKHSTLSELRPFIPDFDNIQVFSIDRPTDQIIESDYRLHRIATTQGEVNKDWKRSVDLASRETLVEFRFRRWDPWLEGKSAWDHWTCGYPVTRFEFGCLDWSKVLKLCGVVAGTVERMSP